MAFNISFNILLRSRNLNYNKTVNFTVMCEGESLACHTKKLLSFFLRSVDEDTGIRNDDVTGDTRKLSNFTLHTAYC